MRKTGYYEILGPQERTKWWNMPPALRISCFISNSSAQPGKLIKGCSRACTEQAATAQGGCRCILQAGRRGFVLFPFHIWSSHAPVPPPGRWRHTDCLAHDGMCHAVHCATEGELLLQGHHAGVNPWVHCQAQKGTWNISIVHMNYCGQCAMLMQFPQFQDKKEKFSPSYLHFRQIGLN